MKINLFFIACIVIFILGGCSKNDLSEPLTPNQDEPTAALRSSKKSTLFTEPCPTALIVQNLPPKEEVIVYQISGSFTTTFTTTDYSTLETNSMYRLYIPFGATVYYCSCGENYGELTLPNNNVLHTSSDPEMYSSCDF